MKRTIRILASLLVLVAMLSSMVITVAAEDIGDISEGAQKDVVSKGETVGTNYGTVETNEGTINNNSDKGTVDTNKGTVKENNGEIDTNTYQGTVEKNERTIQTNDCNDSGYLGGTVKENIGTIVTNKGYVEKNNGEIGTNNCINEYSLKSGRVNENNGTIDTNDGWVETNTSTGIITTNENRVQDNYGNIGTNDGYVYNNYNTIGTNNSQVYNNRGTIDKSTDYRVTNNYGIINTITCSNNGETVCENMSGGYIGTCDGFVLINNGTIDINEREVQRGHGTINTNNGIVDDTMGLIKTNNGVVNKNTGSVETNNIEGLVQNEQGWNYIKDQSGTGEVKENYGTTITNTGEKDEDGKAVYTTEYGVQVKNTGSGDGTSLLQVVKDGVLKLSEHFKRDGYNLVGYTQEYQDINITYEVKEVPAGIRTRITDVQLTTGESTVDSDEYEGKCPNILTLIWKAIARPVSASASSSEPEAVQTGVKKTARRFKLIETVSDGEYFLASYATFSDEEIQDLLAILNRLLADSEFEFVIGEPGVLSPELAAQFFGDQGDHITITATRILK